VTHPNSFFICLYDNMEREDNTIPNFIIELLAGKAYGLSTPEKEKRLQHWLTANPQYSQSSKELLVLLEKHYYLNLQKKVNKEKGWKSIQQKIQSKKSIRIFTQKWSKIAALIFVLIGLTWYFKSYIIKPLKDKVDTESSYSQVNNKAVLVLSNGNQLILDNPGDTLLEESGGLGIRNKPGELLTYDQSSFKEIIEIKINKLLVPSGTRYQLLLSDGTKVWMNSLSTLEYPVVFGKSERRVMLKGEAFFEVTHDTTRPFIVVANNNEIMVLGTSFNVSAYESDNRMETTLVEGSVEIYIPGNNSFKLVPSQLATINTLNNSVNIVTVNTRYYTSWKDDILYFDNLPLQELATRLERWYDVEIIFKNERARQLHFSGAMENNRNIQFLLNLISQTTHVKFEINGKKIFVE